MENLDSVWTAVRDSLSRQLTGMSFHKWFENVVPVTVKNNVLIAECPDEITKNTIQNFYGDLFRDTVKASDPSLLDVLLILPAQRREFVETEETNDVNPGALNKKYTFDSFVVGSSNRFAHAAACAVAERPGEAYNPLFLYGGVGLGKTHLMHAIGHEIRRKKPTARVLYATSETFTNELIEALRLGRNADFRQRFRSLDVLMIDDVQFIAGKQSVQEEFFNTFNALHNAGKQIILSSDRPPKEIALLEERLQTRFAWGLIADIQEPDVETRIAILRNKAQHDNLRVSEDIIQFIAENTKSNIRELEGNLNRVMFYAQLNNAPVSLDLVQEALQDVLPLREVRKLTPDVIKETVSSYYNVPVTAIMSSRRDKSVVLPRQVAMYFCHELLGLPFMRIAYLFDRNDHTTIMHACEKLETKMKEDETFRDEIFSIRSRLV